MGQIRPWSDTLPDLCGIIILLMKNNNKICTFMLLSQEVYQYTCTLLQFEHMEVKIFILLRMQGTRFPAQGCFDLIISIPTHMYTLYMPAFIYPALKSWKLKRDSPFTALPHACSLQTQTLLGCYKFNQLPPVTLADHLQSKQKTFYLAGVIFVNPMMKLATWSLVNTLLHVFCVIPL